MPTSDFRIPHNRRGQLKGDAARRTTEDAPAIRPEKDPETFWQTRWVKWMGVGALVVIIVVVLGRLIFGK